MGGTRESLSTRTLSSTQLGLLSGPLQLTSALCGSVVSTTTTPPSCRNARWSTAPSPTSATQRSALTSTAPLTFSDHSAATSSQPSVTVSAQSTLPSTATTTLTPLASAQLPLWINTLLDSSCGLSATSSSQDGPTLRLTTPAGSREVAQESPPNSSSELFSEYMS